MKVIDPGHLYITETYDGNDRSRIAFMKRSGEKYPGNVDAYPGTNCQDVIRILIDRVKYLNNQVPCEKNRDIISHLRSAFNLFELRAADRHGRTYKITCADMESEPHCLKCGHLQCEHMNLT